MSIKISENERKIIYLILTCELPKNTVVYAFGSRVKGTNKKFADLDLAISSEDVLPQITVDKLNIQFENSLLPYKVDVIDLKSIDKDFYLSISKDLIELLKL